MAGLVPAIHACYTAMARRICLHHDQPPNGILYTGVTNDIGRRAYEHREGVVKGFTKRYGLKRLVYMEYHDHRRRDPARKNMKHWPRAWKVRLIRELQS